MISPDKIEEWIREVEERPSSAPNILRYIARRLSDLTARSEELLADNIALRSGKRVEDYESRISNLEYQLELLKRQLGGAVPGSAPAAAAEPPALPVVLLYTRLGRILRAQVDPRALESPQQAALLEGTAALEDGPPALLAAAAHEELLLLFDSGRTETLPAQAAPLLRPGPRPWQQALTREPKAGEELAALVPVGRMALFDFVVQSSRRGYVKKLREDAFETHLANHYIGAGVKLNSDKTCGLALCGKDDLFVMVSREGAVFSMEVARLPFTIEEALRLSPSDQILATFTIQPDQSLLLAAQNGKIVHREASWLEPAASFKGRGQSVLSKARREAGVRLVGAAALRPSGWAAALTHGGGLLVCPAEALFNSGSIFPPGEEGELLSFSAEAG